MPKGIVPPSLYLPCLALLANFIAACGSETPSFQEQAIQGANTGATYSKSTANKGPNEDSIQSADVKDASIEASLGSKDPGQTVKNEASTSPASMAPSPETNTPLESFKPLAKTAESPVLVIEAKDTQLRFGSVATDLSASLGGKAAEVSYTLEAPAGKDPGKIVNNKYVSPALGTQAYEVLIKAQSSKDPSLKSSVTLSLVPEAQVFAGCTQDNKGFPIKAEVFDLPNTTTKLPNFASLESLATQVCMDQFMIPNRPWSDGFPDHPDLIEWFGVRASSHISIAASGHYNFKLNADDGAKLYIDDVLIVDNDGLHPVKAAYGAADLEAGEHNLVIEYFQGPRYDIALELFWRTPGKNTWVYVPKTAFTP